MAQEINKQTKIQKRKQTFWLDGTELEGETQWTLDIH